MAIAYLKPLWTLGASRCIRLLMAHHAHGPSVRKPVTPICWFVCALLALGLATPILGQQASAPAFEAASIKVNSSGEAATTLGFQAGGRFRAVNEPAWRLIGEAFGSPIPLPRERILAGPAWMYADRFDVTAVAQGDPSQDQRRAMLRALLVERFKLIVREEQRQLPVFELTMARSDRVPGPGLRRSTVNCEALLAAGSPLPSPGPGEPLPCVMTFGFGRVAATGMTLEQLASMGLTRFAGRPVINRTELEGPFDWTLIWTPDNLPPRAPGTPPDQPIRVNGIDIDPNGPPLPTALQEQLGLKLNASRGAVPVLVIDRIERPTAD